MAAFTWFLTAFGSPIKDRSAEIQAAVDKIPDCWICQQKVTDPVVLKCGHIFDKQCIQKYDYNEEICPLGLKITNKCLIDGKDVEFEPYDSNHSIYKSTECEINVGVFPARETSFIICMKMNVLLTMEKVGQKVLNQLSILHPNKIHIIKSMNIRGSFEFCPGKTIADYHILPGEKNGVWVFLA